MSKNSWSGQPVVHGFCVTCGQRVVAYVGSYAAYDIVRTRYPPTCSKHAGAGNRDAMGRDVWRDHKYIPEGIFNATHKS